MSKIKFVCPHCHTTNQIPSDRQLTKAHCGKCKHSLLDTKPINLTLENFHKHIERNEVPVVVDFWAEWCGPCKMMAPAFEQNATHFGQKVRFVKVNTEEEQQIAAHYGIRSIPTMILFKDGKEADRVSGALPAEQMKSWIAQRI